MSRTSLKLNIYISPSIEKDDFIEVRHDFNRWLPKQLKNLEVTYFSKTRKCWMVKRTDYNLSKLNEICKGFKVKFTKDFDEENPQYKPTKDRQTKNSSTSPEYKLNNIQLQSVKRFLHFLRQKRYAESSIRVYRSNLLKFLEHYDTKELSDFSNKDIEDYNYNFFILGARSYSHQNQFINAVKLFFKFHQISQVDIEEIERPRRSSYLPTVLTKTEVHNILLASKNLKHRALLMLIYSAGLRIGEALNLKPSDLSQEENLIYIRGAKGKKDRRVPLSQKIRADIKRYLQQYKPEVYLFEGSIPGRKYSPRSAQQVLKRCVKEAKIKRNITLHTLRHSYATHLLDQGINLRFIQEVLGHKSPNTTMIYTHVSSKNLMNVKSPLDDMEF